MTDARRATGVVLPVPTRIVVADNEDVDAIIRAARAQIAKLSLELRALEHDVVTAGNAGDDDAGAEPDAPELRDLLTRLERRRREMSIEVGEARMGAAQRIRRAQSEAAALACEARNELLAVLTATAGQRREVTPPLVERHPEPPTPAAAPATLIREPALPVPARSVRARRAAMLHPDVLMPLTAVAIVVIVLVAWLA